MDMSDNGNSSNSFLIIAWSLGLGLVFNWLFYDKLVGISYPLFIAVTLFSYFGLSSYFKTRLAASAWVLGIVILTLASFVAIRDSMSLTFFNVAASFCLLLVLASLSYGRKLGDYEIMDYFKAVFKLPFQFLASIPGVIASLAVSGQELRQNSRNFSIIRGLVITLPILVVFVLLFSSADLVFQKYLGKIFDFDTDLMPRFLLVSLITFAFVGAFGYLFQREKVMPQSTVQNNPTSIGLTEVKILFWAINALFLAFILVQITYLFGGEDNITQLGFTYAEYARKGFFELIVVAAFSFLLIFAVERHAPRSGDRHVTSFKILASVLIMQVILIMASSFKRLLLYENAYGFTVERFFAHALTIGLGLVFLLLLYKIVSDQKENKFVFSSFAVTILFLIGLNIFNPEAFIAKKNIDQRLDQNQPQKLDISYLGTLSTDATAQIARLLNFPDKEIQRDTAFILNRHRNYVNGAQAWQSFHFGRSRARETIQASASRIDQLLEEAD